MPMDRDTPTIAAAPAAHSTGSHSGLESFSPEIRADARRRLSAAALIYAGCYAIAFGAELLLDQGTLSAPSPEAIARSVLAISMALLVAWLARSPRLGISAFAPLAQAFQVLGGLGIVSGMWGWEGRIAHYIGLLEERGLDVARVMDERFPLFTVDGVPWLGIWIIVFPLVVPLTPMRAFVSCLLTALTFHVVAFGSQLAHGPSAVVEAWIGRLYIDFTVPLAISVGVGVFGARVIYRLTRDLSRAQEMGSYRLVEKIGSGGMGEVWKARHRMLVRPAAVKLIRAESVGDLARARFEREAQATAGLQSPHTVQLYDFGVTDDGSFYYVMELLEGIDLRTLVEQYGPVPAARTVHFLRQACHSLGDAHASGLVHRDIKPANLIACRCAQDLDFIKVLDFGLVKDVRTADEAEAQLTQQGTASGTPPFMAPEIITGTGEVDGRADLYALGCVAYWLLTGKFVFEGDTPLAIMVQHAKDEPVAPSTRAEIDVPRELDDLILQCLRKDPAGRPQSADQLSERLATVEAQTGAWSRKHAERWWRVHMPEHVPPGHARTGW
ncbi:MAG: serine/threonine protein kinase [Gemmatimonadetes bacterium]|nr:serine/threonine protein kinase [Gemmatimonadota bacterium]